MILSTKPKKEKRILIDLDTVRIKEYDDRNCVIEIRKGDKWKRKGYYSSVLLALRVIQSEELLIDPDEVYNFMTYLTRMEVSNAKLREVIRKHDTVQLQSCKSV